MRLPSPTLARHSGGRHGGGGRDPGQRQHRALGSAGRAERAARLAEVDEADAVQSDHLAARGVRARREDLRDAQRRRVVEAVDGRAVQQLVLAQRAVGAHAHRDAARLLGGDTAVREAAAGQVDARAADDGGVCEVGRRRDERRGREQPRAQRWPGTEQHDQPVVVCEARAAHRDRRAASAGPAARPHARHGRRGRVKGKAQRRGAPCAAVGTHTQLGGVWVRDGRRVAEQRVAVYVACFDLVPAEAAADVAAAKPRTKAGAGQSHARVARDRTTSRRDHHELHVLRVHVELEVEVGVEQLRDGAAAQRHSARGHKW